MVKNKILILILLIIFVFSSTLVFADNNDTYELEQLLLAGARETSFAGWTQGRYATRSINFVSQQVYTAVANGTSYITLDVQYQLEYGGTNSGDWRNSTSDAFVQINGDRIFEGNYAINQLPTGFSLTYRQSGTQYVVEIWFILEQTTAPNDPNTLVRQRVSSHGYVIINNSTPSYQLGYNNGYDIGYDTGYDLGFQDGLSENPFEINPVLVIFNSVEQMLSVKIFGSLSLGQIVTGFIGILFVIWFLKMFKGG